MSAAACGAVGHMVAAGGVRAGGGRVPIHIMAIGTIHIGITDTRGIGSESHGFICAMPLGNMRANGVRSTIVTCWNIACRHEAIVNASIAIDLLQTSNVCNSAGQCLGGRKAAHAAARYMPTEISAAHTCN